MKKSYILIVCFFMTFLLACAQQDVSEKYRILVSTDIGGTDPDDNQSMAHLLMYSDRFDIEGLISSPSFGKGSKEEILRMIDLYEKDFKKLQANNQKLMTPAELRKLCKQGRQGLASYKGFDKPTEGSEWIIKCARREDTRPLYVLVWGTLEDVAQALHDAPDIQSKIRVYWIGGPNKKWGVNSYAYVAENFPDLWMIENNASYRGLISNKKIDDEFNNGYYDKYIKNAGHLGADFIHYYDGLVKMGDTPSLLYMMNGDPADPYKESWGGSFEKMSESPHTIFTSHPTIKDTVAVYSVLEFRFNGPEQKPDAVGQKFFTFRIDRQNWDGIYLGNGVYGVRYSPKAPAVLSYEITSDIKELNGLKGTFVVGAVWPGKSTTNGYKLGENWYTDKQTPALFEGVWQGSKTVSKWRKEVLTDWGIRWEWLKKK
mgnify:FL=1